MAETKQPKIDTQQLFSDLINKEPETVKIGDRKVSIGWIHKETESRISNVMLKEKNNEKRHVKWYSLVRLDCRNGFLTWLLGWLWYWIYWRWIWYVKHERGTVFQIAVVQASKKKIQERSELLSLSTISMIEAMDTMMTIAQHESGQAEPPGVGITL